MTGNETASKEGTREAVLGRVRTLSAGIREHAAAAEEARQISRETIDKLLAAGIARVLIPRPLGGYGLELDTWFEVTREIGKSDASHAWCASLMMLHPYCVAQFPKDAQQAVWSDGLDVAIAASALPIAKVAPVEGGYRISGQFPYASGINFCQWALLGGLVEYGGKPEWTFFLVASKDFTIINDWSADAMRATGSNSAVCKEVFVPSSHTKRLSDFQGKWILGRTLQLHQIHRVPLLAHGPLTFAAPILGAAQGAYETFRDWTKTRRGMGGIFVAELNSVQVRLARSAADLDAANYLMRRAVDTIQASTQMSVEERARSLRDIARATELCVGAIDELIAMSGTAGFAASSPIQRAWRDIHFAGMHVNFDPEQNFAYFGRLELGVPQDPDAPIL